MTEKTDTEKCPKCGGDYNFFADERGCEHYRCPSCDHMELELDYLRNQLTSLRTKHEALVGAARPFVHDDLCRRLGGNVGDESPVFQRDSAVLTLGDFNRLRQALSGEAPFITQETAKRLLESSIEFRTELSNHKFHGEVVTTPLPRLLVNFEDAIAAAERELKP